MYIKDNNRKKKAVKQVSGDAAGRWFAKWASAVVVAD